MADRQHQSRKLNLHQKLQIASRLVVDREKILRERPNYTVLARHLTDAFGYYIHPQQIIACANAAGVIWKPAPKASPGSNTIRFFDLIKRVNQLEQWVDQVSGKFGVKIPDRTGTEENNTSNEEMLAGVA